jgi:hypothetical protein
MADAGLFIGWGSAVYGREEKGIQVFNEAVDYFTGLQQAGQIEGFETVFLEPHGGDLSGFFLVRGGREELARIRVSEELNRLTIRASQIAQSFGVVGAQLGDAIQAQVGAYLEAVNELS